MSSPNPGTTSDQAALRLGDLANAAGAITIARLILAVTFPLIMHAPDWALFAYVVAVISDVVDGNLARWTGTASHTGGVLDGWVDKILHINVAWSMVLHGLMPGWWMWLWFSREIIQGGMVIWLTGRFHRGEVQVQHTSLPGRITAVSLAAVVVLTFLGHTTTALCLTWCTGAAGIVSGVGYFFRALDDRLQLR
jgi:cardiolipin synthase